ncbi:MAG: hypothetical protein LQ338_003532 [Usnochroma carphineum]|nr:MAG: hypothetical protein LQ338_003532 [Usnochroma carphineum]
MPRASARKPPSTSKPPPAETPSPVALENNISASTEHSIREAFLLFATHSSASSPSNDDDDLASHTLPSTSLKPALKALGISNLPKAELTDLLDAADPDDSGSISYPAFVGVAALKLSSRDDSERQDEIDEAFRLFLGEGRGRREGGEGSGAEEDVITMSTLKRVAAVLKEDVDEKVLRDMILEANGGKGVRVGVGRAEFGEVMRRAGVLR